MSRRRQAETSRFNLSMCVFFFLEVQIQLVLKTLSGGLWPAALEDPRGQPCLYLCMQIIISPVKPLPLLDNIRMKIWRGGSSQASAIIVSLGF